MAELTKQPSRKRVRELPISETESGIQEIENRTSIIFFFYFLF